MTTRLRQFVDELVSLPLHWRHTHSFTALDDGSTRVTDHVETPVPGSLLLQTFRYRHRQLADDLAAHRRPYHGLVDLDCRSHGFLLVSSVRPCRRTC